MSYDQHHHISQVQTDYTDLLALIGNNEDDPLLNVRRALLILRTHELTGPQNFIPDLKDHCLSRILGEDFDGGEHAFTNKDRDNVQIVNNRIYRHGTMRVNYTTYDGRRDQDSINSRTHADIMVLNPGENGDGEHPYWYGRVYGIFHTKVRYTGPGGKHGKVYLMHFLWVRWHERTLAAPGGFGAQRLPRVGFMNKADPAAFGFLDPSLVMRGCHMIPAFFYHKVESENIIKTALQRPRDGDDESDWQYYYVNM